MSTKTRKSDKRILSYAKASAGRPKLRFSGFFSEWEEKRLGEIAKTFSGGTPTSTKVTFYSGQIPLIKSGEISKDKTAQHITKEAMDNSSAKLVKKGDLLFLNIYLLNY